VLKAAIRYISHGKQIIRHLLQQRGGAVEISKEVVKAALSNEYSAALEVLTIRHDASRFSIDDTLYEAAATAGQHSFLDLLQEWQGVPKHSTKWHQIALLYRALSYRNLSMMENCIAEGTSLYSSNIRGETPLWISIKKWPDRNGSTTSKY
jgi:hypothetical protein